MPKIKPNDSLGLVTDVDGKRRILIYNEVRLQNFHQPFRMVNETEFARGDDLLGVFLILSLVVVLFV